MKKVILSEGLTAFTCHWGIQFENDDGDVFDVAWDELAEIPQVKKLIDTIHIVANNLDRMPIQMWKDMQTAVKPFRPLED